MKGHLLFICGPEDDTAVRRRQSDLLPKIRLTNSAKRGHCVPDRTLGPSPAREDCGTRLITLLHPREGLLFVAQGEVDINDQGLTDVLMRCSRFQLLDSVVRFVAFIKQRMDAADLGH